MSEARHNQSSVSKNKASNQIKISKLDSSLSYLQSNSDVIFSSLQASLLLIPLFFVRYDLHCCIQSTTISRKEHKI